MLFRPPTHPTHPPHPPHPAGDEQEEPGGCNKRCGETPQADGTIRQFPKTEETTERLEKTGVEAAEEDGEQGTELLCLL